jgi:hypothetical protein
MIVSALNLVACIGGKNSNNTPQIYPNPNPPNVIQYPTPPIFDLPNFDVANGVVNPSHNQDQAQNFNITNLAIAYSDYNSNTSVAAMRILDMSGLVIMKQATGIYSCTAIPIMQTDNGYTVFITAAHCFVNNKNSPTALFDYNITAANDVFVYYGQQPNLASITNRLTVASIYLPMQYCYGATFNNGGHCPLFYYTPNTQQNDIAVFVANGTFGNANNFPKLIPPSQYPQVYTGAPILSIGYGAVNNSNQQPVLINGSPQAFYINSYYYMLNDNPGYHHVYNSYFNTSQQGYTTLICEGDSGGPDLFWDGTNWDIISEHTFGPAGVCGGFFKNLYYSNVATNVGNYYNWIVGITTSVANADNNFCLPEAGNNCIQVGLIK